MPIKKEISVCVLLYIQLKNLPKLLYDRNCIKPTKINVKPGEMAQWRRVLALQAWEPEFKSQEPTFNKIS